MFKHLNVFRMLDEGGGGGQAPTNGDNQQTGNEPDYKALYEAAQAKITELSTTVVPRASYATLQTQLNRSQGELQKAQGDLATLKSQYDETVVAHTSLTAKATELEKTLGQTAAEKKALAARTVRQALILKEFPDLAPFEGQGLIADAAAEGDPTEENYRAIFTNFRAQLQVLTSAARTTFSAGGSPPAPAPNSATPQTKQALQLAMNQAALTGNRAEFQRLHGEFLKLP